METTTRKKNVRLTPEQRKEVYAMYKDGANQYELADMFDVSQRTVSSIIKEQSIAQDGFAYDRTHVGSRIAKTINPLPKLEEKPKPKATSPVIEDQTMASSVVVSRAIIVKGLGTGFEYLISTDQDYIEIMCDSFQAQIAREKLNDFVLELQGVIKNMNNVTKGCEAW